LRKPFFRQVAWCLVFAMFIVAIAPRVEAGIAPSEVFNPSLERVQALDKIQKTIEAKLVRERLEKLGYTTAEVQARLERLSDQQLHELALNLDSLKVAGSDGLGIIVALLVIAILVVILLQVTGHKVIVK